MSTFIHDMTIYDPSIDDNIRASLHGETDPGEKMTHDCPGSDPAIWIDKVVFNGQDITNHFSEKELNEIANDVAEDMNDSIDPDEDDYDDDYDYDEAADRYFEHLYEPNY